MNANGDEHAINKHKKKVKDESARATTEKCFNSEYAAGAFNHNR
jgi:hypothetical protein